MTEEEYEELKKKLQQEELRRRLISETEEKLENLTKKFGLKFPDGYTTSLETTVHQTWYSGDGTYKPSFEERTIKLSGKDMELLSFVMGIIRVNVKAILKEAKEKDLNMLKIEEAIYNPDNWFKLKNKE